MRACERYRLCAAVPGVGCDHALRGHAIQGAQAVSFSFDFDSTSRYPASPNVWAKSERGGMARLRQVAATHGEHGRACHVCHIALVTVVPDGAGALINVAGVHAPSAQRPNQRFRNDLTPPLSALRSTATSSDAITLVFAASVANTMPPPALLASLKMKSLAFVVSAPVRAL